MTRRAPRPSASRRAGSGAPDGVPADHDVVVDRLLDRLGVERRDGAHQRLGGAPRVEHVALADRAGADRRAQVVVAADREHGAARLRQGVAGVAERRAGEGRLGQQPRRRARPLDRLVPPAAASADRASRCARPAQLGDLVAPSRCTTHPPTLSQRTPRSLGHVVAQPAVLRHRAQRTRRQPGVARKSGISSSIRRASSSPRESCQAIEGTTGSPSRPSSMPVSAMPDTPSADHRARRRPRPAPAAPPPARTPRTPRARSRRRSGPGSRRSAPGRARSPRRPG